MINNTHLKIASISAEVAPYSKSGGLADVACSLPKALKQLGHEVIIITPLYGFIDPVRYNLKKIFENINVIIDNKNKEQVNVWQGELEKWLPVYFIENEKYFTGRQIFYRAADENARFLLFDLAALKLLTKLHFAADIIHCHDWHTGLIPYFLKRDFQTSETLKNSVTVYTIHNLIYQLGHNWWTVPEKEKDLGRANLPSFKSKKIESINFAKRAIKNADVINTVSETYAQEILTKDFGQDLHRLLKKRKKTLFGILNGIDYNDYNPHNDPGLHRNYDWHNFEVKEKNKLFIQKFYGLAQMRETPLICMTSRIVEQKGFDLIKGIAEIIFRFNLQIIIMGDGEEKMISDLKKLQKNNPEKLIYVPFETKMETSLYAGSDFILMPSRFEPCGINQMKSMRYGCVPIARHVGGLSDTVYDYNPANGSGNGFSFVIYDSRAMLVAITRALETFKRENEWKTLVQKIMRQSFSWEYPARKYVELFEKAMEIRNNNSLKH